MGDDRHGQSPRPGGRAPWERYATADSTEREGSRASRRSRHDAPPEPGAAPLTVQDLVEKVDNERTGRRRRAAPQAAQRPVRTPEAPPEAPRGGPDPVGPESARPAPVNRPPAARPEAGPRRAGPARPGTGSVVVDDIVGKPAKPAKPPKPPQVPRPPAGKRQAVAAEPAEAVTDVLPPVAEPAEPEAEPPVKSRTGRSATPKPVGKPLSRLAAGKQRRNRRLKTTGRITAALFAVLVLLITGGGWSYLRSTNNAFTQVSALDENPEDVIDSGAQLGDENFLLVGTDTRAGVNGQIGAGTLDDAEGARADTVMLVHIPKNRKRVVAVSFPRDLDVTRPQCNGWDNDKGEYTKDVWPSAMGDKLNAVYALAGPRCLVNVVRKMTGLTIGHFIGIDFAGFEAMVDRIGGVEVCAPKPIVDGVLGTVLENPGKQRVNGETALNYVRARHVYGEERSDYDRINRQQRFMSSLLRGAMSSRVLFDPGKLNGFIEEFTRHTWVDNVKSSDLLTLGRSLQKVDAGAITFLTIPTAGTTSYGNEIPRESDIKAIFSAVRDDRPLPGEKTPTHDPTTSTSAAPEPPKYIAVDPNSIPVLVSNGSGEAGAANTAANKLSAQGFQITGRANYSQGMSATTKVRYGPGHEADAATVATAVPGASLESDGELGSIVEVVLGQDYTGTIRTPTPVGDPINNVTTTTGSSASTPTALPSDLEAVNAADETCK
ncbi:LCP family protein [Nocardia arizonensis]|uniref:LCP family protein n=1 Tax=Nocardia arizonensis TaxID=1141647 RepID=UPI0006D1B848|nr:LCP family protein [Nocardia arizonensis]